MTSFIQCNQGDSFRLHALAGPTFYVMCNSIYISIPQVVYMYVLIDTWIFFRSGWNYESAHCTHTFIIILKAFVSYKPTSRAFRL